MTELHPKKKSSAAFKGFAVIVILALFITNAITLYMLIKTGFALQQSFESKPVIVTQIVEQPEPEEEMVPSIPVSLFFSSFSLYPLVRILPLRTNNIKSHTSSNFN